ncbi:hypothetical protein CHINAEXTREME_15235 [Halobiforma lacisalsi AJ5]|uniref:DUF7345 domain-containing protein n=1 Tax=Natronobacterium lacisalsi AJ5 TaxID=358396 RepID=M0LCJ4_NATLA|nr:PGF-CTERM sorting domain-containing protein [Halobiforma lacisalsi]APW99043.1 hypothetical protein CHINAEXTREME_15235 [Halobiforma lacisalsi AJ5]EMA31306.1 hypothetical protein C445_14659 [Halobiforma lacisalsi AJ5]
MPRSIAVVAVASLLLASVLVTPVAATTGIEDPDESTVHVAVETTGDATVSLVTVYELSDETERAAFESLENDESAQHELRDRFAERMASVADGVGEDGATTITDESIDVRTEGERGIVTVSVTWTDFAETDGDTLVVAEPFASGFEADQPLVVAGPDGSTIERVSHEPDEESEHRASWDAGTDLSGFEMAFSLEGVDTEADGETETGAGAGDKLPGFGVGVALVAIVAGVGLARRAAGRRSRAE